MLPVSGKPGAFIKSGCYPDHLLKTGDGPYLTFRGPDENIQVIKGERAKGRRLIQTLGNSAAAKTTMSLFNSIANLFKKPPAEPTESDARWREGYTTFQLGEDLYFQNQIDEALSYFDTAVDSGFECAGLFAMRGGCLQTLGFDLDAIDDFTRAIELEPDDSNHYYMRSISRGAVGDLQGRVDDLSEAIRVAGIPNAANFSHNEWARENGFKNGIIGKYQLDLVDASLDIDQQASDERRLKGPGADLGPDLVSRRRSRSRRRTR